MECSQRGVTVSRERIQEIPHVSFCEGVKSCGCLSDTHPRKGRGGIVVEGCIWRLSTEPLMRMNEKSMAYSNDIWIPTKLSSQGKGTGRRPNRTLFY